MGQSPTDVPSLLKKHSAEQGGVMEVAMEHTHPMVTWRRFSWRPQALRPS